MSNKSGIIIMAVAWLNLFCGPALAQYNDIPNVGTSEASKMSKNHNGLISSSQMQAYQKESSDEGDKSVKKTAPKKWTIKRR